MAAMGRPSKYRQKYVEEVVTYCAEGFSLTAFAGEIGVDRDTITEWCAQHPEFSVAVARAKAKRARFWEQQAVDLAKSGGQSGRATMVIFGLKNHAPEDFAEVRKHELTGKDGAPLSIDGERAEDRRLLELAIAAGKVK